MYLTCTASSSKYTVSGSSARLVARIGFATTTAPYRVFWIDPAAEKCPCWIAQSNMSDITFRTLFAVVTDFSRAMSMSSPSARSAVMSAMGIAPARGMTCAWTTDA